MSALVRKETRLLLGSWVAALAVATMPLWLGKDLLGAFPTIYGVAILILALSPFGQETSRGTFGLLLVQPLERRGFWRVKTRLLAIALVSVWALLAVCLWSIRDLLKPDGWGGWLLMTGLMTLLAFSGGLWSALLLRDMVPAFTCACVVPGLITVATLLTVGHWIRPPDPLFPTVLCWILAVYGVAGFFWARRLFLEAQDVGWSGSQISLTAGRGLSLRCLAFELKSRQNRWSALIKKELQLQQPMMVLVPLLALLHLAALVIGRFFPQWTTDKDLTVSIIPGIWMAGVPAVIGCVAAAEERRLRTLDGQLCLPISKRAQFLVKLAVVLALGVVLGGVIPWILLRISGVSALRLDNAVRIAALITGIAFYASTMSGGLLEALTITACIPVLAGMTVSVILKCFFNPANDMVFLDKGIFSALAWPVLTVTVLRFACKNYQRLQVSWRVWVGDLARVGAVTGCLTLASIAIFDRSWEWFMPLEPRHGPPALSGPVEPAMANTMRYIYVLLPDGRLWAGEKRWIGEDSTFDFIPRGFLPGSNWVNLAANGAKVAAIRSDGTLWQGVTGLDLHQLGSDSDWSKLAGGAGAFLAVKHNGTLWGWGLDNSGILHDQVNPNPHYYIDISAPVRLGHESDWVNVFLTSAIDDPNPLKATAVKRDGSTWNWGRLLVKTNVSRATGWGRRPINEKVRGELKGTNWVSIAGTDQLTLAVRGDGTLWVRGYINSKVFGEGFSPFWYQKFTPFGRKADWVSVSGEWQMAALEADGNLWVMKLDRDVSPSKYSDWVAATEAYGCTWGLARDGTLSAWNEFEMRHYSTIFGGMTLGPARRPVYSGNILK